MLAELEKAWLPSDKAWISGDRQLKLWAGLGTSGARGVGINDSSWSCGKRTHVVLVTHSHLQNPLAFQCVVWVVWAQCHPGIYGYFGVVSSSSSRVPPVNCPFALSRYFHVFSRSLGHALFFCGASACLLFFWSPVLLPTSWEFPSFTFISPRPPATAS